MFAKKGQSISEYAIVIGIAVMAISGVSIFVSRSLKAKEKDFVDASGAIYASVYGQDVRQYEPYYTSSYINTDTNSTMSGSYINGLNDNSVGTITHRDGWRAVSSNLTIDGG